jgi:outer membrane protein assembly factor BamB
MSPVRVRGWARGALGAAALMFAAGSLAGCALFGRSDHGEKLPGKRYSVLTLENQIEADPALASLPVTLPPPVENSDWTQPGGTPSGDFAHLALGQQLNIAWTVKVGEGKAGTSRIVAPPIVAGGKVFTLDAHGSVTAVDAKTGSKLWTRKLAPKTEDPKAGYGGGLAYADGRIFVSSGFGAAVALDSASGKEIWRHSIGVPLRAAPVANEGHLFVLTDDNQIYALATSDGHEEWNYQGIVEPARLLSDPSVAVERDTVIVPFSSGEVFALRVENGGVLWSDSLTRTGPQTSLSTLSDIAGRPVIDRGLVYAVSHSGRMAAIDIRSGERQWALNLASADAPWAAGDFVYVITVDNEIVCLTRDSGKVKWVGQLARYEKPKDKEDPIEWTGPVLAGGRLIAVSSRGQILSISPLTGKPLGAPIDLKTGTFVSPVVAGRTLYILTGDARLIAFR